MFKKSIILVPFLLEHFFLILRRLLQKNKHILKSIAYNSDIIIIKALERVSKAD